jgi:hypothetical protein
MGGTSLEICQKDFWDMNDPELQSAFGWGIHKDGE